MSAICSASYEPPVARKRLSRRVPSPCSNPIPPNTWPVCSQTYTFPPLLRTVERLAFLLYFLQDRNTRDQREEADALRSSGARTPGSELARPLWRITHRAAGGRHHLALWIVTRSGRAAWAALTDRSSRSRAAFAGDKRGERCRRGRRQTTRLITRPRVVTPGRVMSRLLSPSTPRKAPAPGTTIENS